MGATDRFSTTDVQRIVGLTAKQLDYWDRLRLVSPRKELGNRLYDFCDLISLRTVKQSVDQGVPANRLIMSPSPAIVPAPSQALVNDVDGPSR